MAKENKEQEKEEKKWKKRKEDTEKKKIVKEDVSLIRILATDIPGHMNVYAGLTKIKGISWNLSNAICKFLGLEKTKKISELSEQELASISEFVKNPRIPSFIMNRRKDFESGLNKHLIGTDIDLQKEFDIKRLRKIRSYRGLRHATGQPVRGQRTKSHFRMHRAVGVLGKKKGKKG